MSVEKPILFFDGVCHLCNGFVDALLQRDRKNHLAFAPLQGKTAQTLLTASERASLQSIIFVDGSKKYVRSEAVLRALMSLDGMYRIFGIGLLLPPFLRDWLYSWIARNRHSWFGKSEVCRLPTAEERGRLLD